jgi:hypothetical protein
MRFRSTLVLAILCVALGAYIYFVELERAAEEEKKETLFTFETKDVTSVALSTSDRRIELKKSEGKWRLTAPLEADADETSVDNLVKAIAECEVKRKLEDVPEDLTPYGLGDGSITVRVTLASGELPEIKVGKTTPVGFSTYVKRADKPEIFLTGSAFRSGMDKQVKDLRDKKILAFDDAQVEEIALGGTDRDVLLKKSDGKWNLERPGPYAADAATVQSFLTNLKGLRATDFPSETPENLAEYGLDTPRLTVRVSAGAAGKPIVLLVGKEKDDDKDVFVKVADRPTVYAVGSWVVRDLDKGPNDFRDKTLFAFAKDDAGAIELSRGDGETFVLKRDEAGAWKMENESAVPTASTVDRLLGDLAALKGYEIAADAPADLAAYGLAAPTLTIAVRDKEGKEIGTVLFGSYEIDSAKQYAAMRQGQETVLRVRDYTFNQLNKKKADFLPKPTPTAKPKAAEPTRAAPAS